MRRLAILGIFLLCTTSGPLSRVEAMQVWDTFGPDNSYDTSVGATVSGATSAAGVYNVAYSFIPDATVTLDSIDVAMGLVSGHNNQTFVVEAADGPSGGPGVALDLIKVTGQAVQLAGGVTSIISADSTFHPLLVAGSTYWLVAEASGDTQAAWGHNDQGYTGMSYSQRQSVSVPSFGETVGAFRINGTPDSGVLGAPSAEGSLSAVPEPSAMVSLALGLSGLVAAARSRRLIRRHASAA